MGKFLFFIFTLPYTLHASERMVSKDTPLYETSSLQRKKVQILNGSRIKILQSLKSKSKIRIMSEPYLSGRRDRSGTDGWIHGSHYTKRTRRVITRDELFDTVEQATKTIPEVRTPRLSPPCTSCEIKKRKSSDSKKYQPGCEALKKIETFPTEANEQKLKKCTDSLISLAKKLSMSSGHFKGVGGQKFQKIELKLK